MEPERVGSFGCRPQRKLSKLLLNLSRSSATTTPSKKSPVSNGLTSPKTPKSPCVSSSSRRTSSVRSPKTPKSPCVSSSSRRTTSDRSPKPKSPCVSSSSRRTSSVRSREDDYKEVFRRFDKDNDGKISAVELRSYFGSVGEYISHEDAQAVIAELDTDGDNLIDFRDFTRLMNKEEKNDDDDVDEDLKKAFEMFEMEKGSGDITPKSLQRVLSRLGEVKTYEECVNMIQVYDTDGKGVLRFHDFQQMMLA